MTNKAQMTSTQYEELFFAVSDDISANIGRQCKKFLQCGGNELRFGYNKDRIITSATGLLFLYFDNHQHSRNLYLEFYWVDIGIAQDWSIHLYDVRRNYVRDKWGKIIGDKHHSGDLPSLFTTLQGLETRLATSIEQWEFDQAIEKRVREREYP